MTDSGMQAAERTRQTQVEMEQGKLSALDLLSPGKAAQFNSRLVRRWLSFVIHGLPPFQGTQFIAYF